MRAFGTAGSGAGQLDSAYRLVIGPEGDIWASEYGNNRVQVFTPAGELVYQFGTEGSGNGQFHHARGISVYGSSVYVVDSGVAGVPTENSRVEKWSE
jgi:tripartite motif-containing protein 71